MPSEQRVIIRDFLAGDNPPRANTRLRYEVLPTPDGWRHQLWVGGKLCYVRYDARVWFLSAPSYGPLDQYNTYYNVHAEVASLRDFGTRLKLYEYGHPNGMARATHSDLQFGLMPDVVQWAAPGATEWVVDDVSPDGEPF